MTEAGVRPRLLAGIGVVLFAAGLGLTWQAADTLLLIFAGILFGVFLDGLARLLGQVLPLGHGARLALVSVLLAGLVLGLAGFGGATVAAQADTLGQTLKQQTETVRGWLRTRGIDTRDLDLAGGEGAAKEGAARGALPNPSALLSEAGRMLGQASMIAVRVFGAIGNLFVVVALGLFLAAQPAAYREGMLRFVPRRHRSRAAEILDATGETLRHWLFGQLAIMAAIFVCVWLGLSLLGLDGALILGLQAGLLCFIPTVGALVAGLVIVLAGLAQGLKGALGGLAIYLLVQALESYVLTPFIQKRALDIPPATIFAGQILLGVLLGLWGIALALPLMAVAKVLLDRLYRPEIEA
ncbi:AI-2E family transporter [Methylobacterium sp. WSM2598]|uniref:AI-2E family transporter n=1 Tax=Methylobacterium sp. WSM2598 TaxID=398261 RepID=UPI0003729D35|nr:AI-2E family transporter [Methylobacterium sp. WSM2598]